MRSKILSSGLAILWGLMASRAAFALPAQEPLFLVAQVRPMVMFAMSVDHQLFVKAFADYSDLNGDGTIDDTYTDSFDYYGYFDSDRCYQYDSSNDWFSPKNAASGTNSHHCNNSASSGDWSGNFLNWAAMTRIDVLRKALYGGKRIVDTTSQTVLERALLPHDVHSFVKVFTPSAGDSIANYMPTAYASATTVSMCNSTPPPSSGTDRTESMNTANNHPKIRIAKGGWDRWSADEVYQCEWRNNGVSPGTATNLFSPNTSSAPSVRVETCVTGKLEANCKSYNSIDAKPVGLLQDYGEDGTLRFGLTSGSYQKRDKGGVLRKAVGLFAGNASASDDEINLTDGTFNTSLNGIISTLNKVRINTWDYSNRRYEDCSTYGISINTYLTSTASNRKCSNWGNPISELYLEAVRFLIGETSPTSTFNVASDSLSLPTATWNSSTDPMPSTEYCTPMNVVLLSSGDNSFDTDHLGTVPSVLGTINTSTDAIGTQEGYSGQVFIGEVGNSPVTNPDSNVCTAKTFSSLSQMRGLCPATPAKQGGYAVAGIAYKAHTTDLRTATGYIGDQTIDTFAIAMAKSLPDFKLKAGSGLVTLVPNAYAGPTGSMPPVVSTQWKASSLAHITIEDTVYNASNELIYVRFLAQWEDSAWGNDYDMDVISRISACVGAECTNHDDDGVGGNDTNPGASTVRVTTRVVHKYAGVSVKVGFVASGTTADGEYTTLRHPNSNNFSINEPGFGNDNPGREPTPTIYTFSSGSSSAGNLPSPLLLAAKYGSFNDTNNNDLPDLQAEWDADSDGVPDSFFFADDPSQIGPKLASYLATIATTSSSASVVANTVSLRTSTRIYQARFDSDDWSGQVLSFPVDMTTGALIVNASGNPVAEWDAGVLLGSQNHDTGREIVTWNGSAGVPFRWASLTSAQQTLLDYTPGTTSSDSKGSLRVNYLRGDDSQEVANGGTFRDRSTPLGDVVNSTPTVVGAPAFGYPESIETVSYSAFKAANDDVDCRDSAGNLRSVASLEREPILYFGGNDGILHGVSACTGQERIGYVPSAVYPDLNELTSPSYTHQYFVDGSVTVVDGFFGGAWHTVLIGSLAGGGKGLFALDVTDPSRFDETYASSLALWDIVATPLVAGSDFEELGYTYSQPSIIKAEGHGWVAVFGNGYHGKSGKAILYVVRLSDGTLLQSIDLSATGHGSGSHGSNNGLATVAPVDTDGDGDADLIYGGDLNGNLWRFAAVTGVGFNRANTTLLYTAKNASGVTQKITSRVAVGYHPFYAVGRMVYFGTGKYYELVDQDPANAVVHNTMYGIWDRDNGQTITSVTTRNSNRLQKQEISLTQQATFGSNTETVRVVSDNPVQWAGFVNGNPETCAVNKSCGWYLDLTDTGEKVVAEPILRSNRLIFVTTTPSPKPCDEGGSGWLMEIDPLTGGRLDMVVLDLNGDGVFNAADMLQSGGNTYPISGTKSKVGIIQSPAILSGIGGPSGGCQNCEGKYFSGSKQAQIDVKTENAGASGEGRKSWIRIK